MERRRTERLFLRIPIAVQGIDQSGEPFTEQTRTIEINRDGARIGLRHTPQLGGEVRITNLLTNFTALFRTTIQSPPGYNGLSEWGVALSAALSDLMPEYWGIAFERLPAEGRPDVSALLVCRMCGRQEMASLTELEYDLLRAKLVFPRACTVCRTSTDWEAATLDLPRRPRPLALPEEARAASPTAAGTEGEGGVQRRGARRVAVHVPILVRTRDGKSEEAVSCDVSKTGLSFATALDVAQGDEIEIVIGYGATRSPTTQPARVVWRRRETEAANARAGVQFIGSPQSPAADQSAAAKPKAVKQRTAGSGRRR